MSQVFANVNILFVVLIFTVWAVSSILYSTKVDSKGKKRQGSVGEDIKFYVLLAKYLSPVIAIASMFSDSLLIFEMFDGYSYKLFACFLSVVGLLVFSLGKVNLGEHYSDCYNAYVPKALVSNGIYAYIRHPIYTGNLLILASCFFFTGSLWSLLILFSMFFYYGKTIAIEEMELKNNIEEYTAYTHRTGAILPALRLTKFQDVPAVDAFMNTKQPSLEVVGDDKLSRSSGRVKSEKSSPDVSGPKA